MRAVAPYVPGSDPTPHLVELPDPVPGPGEVLVRVAAAGLNRADLLQMRGLYPPPAGESAVPGLECAGTIEALGEGVEGWARGQRVMALLAGGGQAEKAVVPVGQMMPVPENLGLVESGGIPEAGLTGWTNLVVEGMLEAGQTVLITGAASGIGTFVVQLARELGARVFVSGRSPERLEGLRALGADGCLPLSPDLPANLREINGRGADLVMDLVGGPWLPIHLAALEPRGRLVLIGLMAGNRVELDLGVVLSRRLSIVGSLLRPRSRAEKAVLVAAFRDFALPRLADGRLKPVIDRVFPFEQVAEAYAALESGGALGKVVLEMRPSP